MKRKPADRNRHLRNSWKNKPRLKSNRSWHLNRRRGGRSKCLLPAGTKFYISNIEINVYRT